MLKLNEKSSKSTYIILALSIIMLVIVGIRLYSDTYAAFMQKDIASQIIRFHIRANDDSEEAQNNCRTACPARWPGSRRRLSGSSGLHRYNAGC